MMTGIQNVNSLEAGYYAATLIFIGWFALYDFRRHLVFGTRGVCLILFIAAISALAFVLLISGRNRSSPLRLPFVPFLFLGSVLWVFL